MVSNQCTSLWRECGPLVGDEKEQADVGALKINVQEDGDEKAADTQVRFHTTQ